MLLIKHASLPQNSLGTSVNLRVPKTSYTQRRHASYLIWSVGTLLISTHSDGNRFFVGSI